MAEVTRLAPRRPTPGVLQRRDARLERRLLDARAQIVWLRAAAGSGKTQLIERLRTCLSGRGWHLVDEPTPASLQQALQELEGKPATAHPRLLVASRPHAPAGALLLKHQAYGLIESLSERELFVSLADAQDEDAALLEATGGWTWLVAAALDGRESAARALLPEFLEREVLPGLTEQARALLCAVATVGLPVQVSGDRDAQCFLLAEQAGHWRLGGEWVRSALHSMQRSASLRTPGVRAHLMHLYAGLTDPAPAIEALLRLGDPGAAFELFRRSGGAYYGYHHGFRALERVLALFDPEVAQRSDDIFLARLWLLVKTGRTREALLRLEARHPALPVDLRRVRLAYRPDLLLLRADMSLDLDGTPPLEVIASWGRLQAFMTPGDELSRGLLYNSMAIGYLQADAIVEARQLFEESLVAYQRARMPYLVHFVNVHLADIDLRQSRLGEAARHIEAAAEELRTSGQAYNSEWAIIATLQSRLAYEQGRFEDCAAEMQPLLDALAAGDSWSDLIPRVAGQVVLAALGRSGLKGALEQLDRCTLAQHRRHGVTASRRLMLVRIRLLQAARRHAEAALLLEEHDLGADARPTPALEIEEGLIRLRHALGREGARAGRARLSESLAKHPALEPRQRVTRALLEAAARHEEGEGALMRRHLRVALREADTHGLIAVLVEDSELLERLLPAFLAAAGPDSERLAGFAASVLKRIKALPGAPPRSKELAGLSRQEHRVLAYAADGCSNKETARALGLSESTVKFHLRSLFRKLQVDSRAALAAAARARGIVT